MRCVMLLWRNLRLFPEMHCIMMGTRFSCCIVCIRWSISLMIGMRQQVWTSVQHCLHWYRKAGLG
ncbi:hypothetical protein D3C76_1664820 [compost metagenome]